MTSSAEIFRSSRGFSEMNPRPVFAVVPRVRGQQLKDQAQLDNWVRDGSARFIEGLCDWQ